MAEVRRDIGTYAGWAGGDARSGISPGGQGGREGVTGQDVDRLDAHQVIALPAAVPVLGQPVQQFAVDPGKRSPRQSFFYKPQMVRQPPPSRM